MMIQLFMEIRVVPIRSLSTWLFSCSTGLFVYYVKYIRLFNLILFCYFDLYMIQYHRHIFTRATNVCLPTKLCFELNLYFVLWMFKVIDSLVLSFFIISKISLHLNWLPALYVHHVFCFYLVHLIRTSFR